MSINTPTVDKIYFFGGEEGAQGPLINLGDLLKIGKFKIPIYQRPYAWEADHFNDLLNTIKENKEYTITEIKEGNQRAAFLGTIIAAKDIQAQSLDNIYIIIDGQQRITSLLLLLKLFFEEIKNIEQDITEEVDILKKSMEDIFKESIGQSNPTNTDKKELLQRHEELLKKRDNLKEQLSKNKEKVEELKEKLTKDRIYRENGNGTSSEDSKEDLKDFKKEKSILHCIPYDSPIDKSTLDTFNKISDQFKEHDISKNPIKSLEYVLKSCQFCLLLVQGPGAEDYAIDIFNSLNSTGEPLTAFEILKSLVHKRNKTEAKKLGAIETTLSERKIKKIKQNKYTDRLLFFLNLMTEGLKQDKFSSFRDKKKVLDIIGNKNTFDKNKLQSFLEEMRCLHAFILNQWEKREQSELFKTEESQICFDFLKSIQHDRPLPILYHFKESNTDNAEKLDEVVKICVAFTGLWRGIAGGGTGGIDKEYADLIKELSNINEVISLKDKMKNKLKEKIKKNIGKKKTDDINEDEMKKKWVENFKGVDIYNNPKLARFLIFIAFHNKHFDQETKSLKKSKQQFLRWQEWNGDDYRTVEHIIPQAHKSIGQIGNLILLPPFINSQVSNSKFIEKKEKYKRCLKDDPSDELPYLGILKEITSYDTEDYGTKDMAEDGHLSESAVDKRGEILGNAIWDTLYQDWLK